MVVTNWVLRYTDGLGRVHAVRVAGGYNTVRLGERLAALGYTCIRARRMMSDVSRKEA